MNCLSFPVTRLFQVAGVLLLASAAATAQQEKQRHGLFVDAPTPQDFVRPLRALEGRARFVAVQDDLLRDRRVDLNLFPGKTLVAERIREVARRNGSSVWIGQIDGNTENLVTLVRHHGVYAGSIRHGGELYELEPLPRGGQVLLQVDESRMPSMSEPLILPEGMTEGAAEPPTALEAGAATHVADLMVVYSASSRIRYGAAGIEAKILAAVEDANQAYLNSAIDLQLELVYLAEATYAETGDMGDALSFLRSPGDGILDDVHAIRDAVGADLVALIDEDANYCGIGYVMTSESVGFASWAFSVTYSGCLSSYTLAHELGHNMGNMHDRDNSSNSGVFPYSYGYRVCGSGGFRTVMSYSCSGAGRIPYFSNPDVLYAGAPLGVDPDLDPVNSAHCALSMNQTADTVAAWRNSAQSPPVSPADLAAEAASSSRIDLTWTDLASDESGYQVERSADGLDWNLIATLPASASSFADTGLAAESTYFYRVRAYNGAGNSGYSNPASATTPAPPLFVDYLAEAESTTKGTVLGSWPDTHDDDAVVEMITERQSGGRPSRRTGELEHQWSFAVAPGQNFTVNANVYSSGSTDGDDFLFEYSSDAGSSWNELFVCSSTDPANWQSAIVPSLASSGLLIRVRDQDRSPGNLALDSVHVDCLVVHQENVEGTPPAAPQGLLAVADSASEVSLTWSGAAEDALGFEIRRSVDQGATFEFLATAAAGATSHLDDSVLPQSDYAYRVLAFNGFGFSAPSNDSAVTTPQGLALSAFAYKVKGKQVVDLAWVGTAAAAIDVYRDGELVAAGVANTGAYTDALGVKGGGSYTYRVCEGGTSNCSNEIRVDF